MDMEHKNARQMISKYCIITDFVAEELKLIITF